MEQAYLTEINIRQIRHLQNIKIELSQNEKKYLLLTGINGCGKTIVLKAITQELLCCSGSGRLWMMELLRIGNVHSVVHYMKKEISWKEIFYPREKSCFH